MVTSCTLVATDLQRLIDSPLVAGRYQRTYTLTPTQTTTPHRVIVTAEDPVDLEMTAEQRQHLSSTIDQAEALFESEPFRGYDFLVTVSSKLRQSVGMGGRSIKNPATILPAQGYSATRRIRSRWVKPLHTSTRTPGMASIAAQSAR